MESRTKERERVEMMIPVEVMGAWETEIPAHDFIGYINNDLTFAAAISMASLLSIKLFTHWVGTLKNL